MSAAESHTHTTAQLAAYRALNRAPRDGGPDWPTVARIAAEHAVHPYQGDQTKPPFPTLLPEQIFAPLPAIASVLPELDMCVGAPVLIAGYGYSMKTLSMQQLALAKAMGLPVWSRFDGVQRLRVIHFDGEQGTRLTNARYQRLANGLGIDWRELADRLQVVVMPQIRLDSPNALDVYARAVDGFDLSIYDSLRVFAPSIEENSSDMRQPLDLLGTVSEKTGVVAIALHHARKPQKDAPGGSKFSIRGSGAIFDACGSVLVFTGAKGEPVSVSHEKARTSGVEYEDFALAAEDVDRAGDPRWGLRVVAKDVEATASRRGDRFEDLKSAVVDALQTDPGMSKNRIAAKVTGTKAKILEAVDELEERGRIVLVGKGYRVR